MNAKKPNSLCKAAQAILNGNCDEGRKSLQSELTAESESAQAWLLAAWTRQSFSDTEEALYRVLELDSENSVALSGLEWLSGVQELAADLGSAGLADASETTAELASAVAVKSTEEEPAQEQTEEAVAEESTEEEPAQEQTEEAVAEESTEEEPAQEQAEEAVAEESTEEEPVQEQAEEAVAEEVEQSSSETQESNEPSPQESAELEKLEAQARREEEELAQEAARLEAEEAARLAQEAEEVRLAQEAEEARLAQEAEEVRQAEEAAEAARLADEAEAKRKAEAERAELERLGEEAEAKAKADAEAAAAAQAAAEAEAEAAAAEAARVAAEQEAAAVAAAAAAAAAAATVAATSKESPNVEEAIQQDIAELNNDVQETLAQPTAETSSVQQAPTENAEQRPIVLAVDDSPTIRKLLTMTLERQGFEVIAAADGVEALTVLSEQLPDVILSDINMPRLGGYQLCKFVKKYERTKHIPVIMLSGKDGVFDKMRGKMAGCNDYIVKPFESNDLVAKVRQHAGALV